MEVLANHIVSIRFVMKNSRGEVMENRMNNDPVSYLHGSAGIHPVLQEQLEGCKTGDKKIVYLSSSHGLTGEDFVFEVIIDEVRNASEEELMLGYPVKLSVAKCEADCDCYNE